MNSSLVIAFLLVLLFVLILVLLSQIRQKKRYKRFIHSIHESLGFSHSDDLNPVSFINQIRRFQYTSSTEESPAESVNVLAYLSEGLDHYYAFLHATTLVDTARMILDEGFKFEDNFYKTTHIISADPVDIKYKIHLSKQHGNLLVIIQIPHELYDFAVNQIAEKKLSILPESILSKQIEEGEMNFLLPSTFVKGFVHLITGTKNGNPFFMQDYSFDEWKTTISDRIEFLNKHD